MAGIAPPPSPAPIALVRERAELAGERHTALAERYLEEGLLMDEQPVICFVDGAIGRRAAVVGSGLDVWEIVQVAKQNYGAERERVDRLIARIEGFNAREHESWHRARENADTASGSPRAAS